MAQTKVLRRAAHSHGIKHFSPERLEKIRRMRMARRQWKRFPLFAFSFVLEHFPDCTFDQFLDDLRLRRPKKKRFKKSPMIRFGRYQKIQSLLSEFDHTGNVACILLANKLKERITQPYDIRVRKNGKTKCYYMKPQTAYKRVEAFVKRTLDCKTFEEVDLLFSDYNQPGGG